MSSKLGVHINFITEADAMREFILTVRPVVVKTLHHDAVFWQEIKSEHPGLLLVGRRYVEGQPLSDPVSEAEHMAASILNMSTAHICDAWEGYNEVSRDRLEPLCRFDQRMAELLHDEGARYVAGSWPVGVPDISDWRRPEMLDALRLADYIGVHEYCAPRMDDPRGLDTHDPTEGWFVLRYRKWYPMLPPDCQKLLLITECGIDSGAVHWDPGGHGGWRSFTDAEGFLEQLSWYDQILQRDSYVAGATVFCWGTLDPAWDSYDISGRMVGLLASHILQQRPEPPPQPPPEDDLEELRQRIAELEQQNTDLSQQLSEAQDRVVELEQESDTLRQQLDGLEARIQDALEALGQ